MIGPDQGSGTTPDAPREAFRLGAEPPKVARLSRKALAVVGVMAGLSIGGALIFALRSPERTPAKEIYATEGRAKADAVTPGPKDYSQVPQLGPPLPGDLGKPILSSQQQAIDASNSAPGYKASSPNTDPRSAAREKARQELLAARASRLFLGDGGVTDAARATTEMPHIATVNIADAQNPTPVSSGSVSGTPAKLAFLGQESSARSVAVAPIEMPASINVVQAGSIIPAALITGIRSDLPGQITAQVTQNVYDSQVGRTVLIPQGSRLIGEYDSQIDTGQTRLLMAWTRLILPDGRSVLLERQPGADAAGYSGLQDKVDNHWGGVARAAMISTLLGFGTELAAGSDADIVRALRRGSQDTINQAGQQIVQRQLAISPTLTIRPGHPLRIMVTRDLVLPPWGEH